MNRQHVRFQSLRKTGATLDTLQLHEAEIALETDGGGNLRLGDGSTLGGLKLIATVDRAGLSEGDILQYRSGKFVRVARGTAVANVDTASLPADGTIAALSFSASPTQAECEALRDECEKLRDTLNAAITTIHALRDRLKTTGGSGIIAD